jgi:hypothetical protein
VLFIYSLARFRPYQIHDTCHGLVLLGYTDGHRVSDRLL